jgi:hypothetical protein
MNARFVFCLIITLAIFSVTVANAQEPELPDPGITPDSWIYGFKRAFETITLFFTFDEVAKVEKRLQYAELRLSEAKTMAEKGKLEYIDNLLEDYGKELKEVNKIASLAKDASTKEKLSELVAKATSHHLEILDKVQEIVPEQAKDKISAAKERSIKGNQEALRVLATENPEKAAELTMNVAEGRINKAKQAVEKGNAEEAAEAAEEYEKYARFGEEIAAIAQQTGKDPSEVHEIVAKATSIHLTILEDVLQKVPKQAKAAIQSAIEESKVGIESAIEALEERGRSISELPPVSEKEGIKVETPDMPEVPEQHRTSETGQKGG